PALVVPLVDARPVLVLLRVEVTRERVVPGDRRVRQPHVRETAVRQFVDLAAVVLDPGARAQRVFARDRYDRDETRALRGRRVIDTDHDLVPRAALERLMYFHLRRDRLAILLEEVIAFRDADARRAERRPQIRIPVLDREDAFDAIVPILDRVVRAEQSDRDRRIGRRVAAAGEIRVADRQLAARLRNEVAEVVAMIHRRDEWRVLRPDGLPIG